MTVVENSESSKIIEATCFCSEEFIGYQGHFPGNPILPAVIQLTMVRTVIANALYCSLVVSQYSATRFKAMIKPDMSFRVKINIEIETPEIHGRFKLLDSDGKTLSSGKFTYLSESL